ncbi:enhancer of mRNA decapping [Batrachochytrium dendrobatidis]|nr:enhancer of mRNA decapping [Batrachochytrium dendrobatidis]
MAAVDAPNVSVFLGSLLKVTLHSGQVVIGTVTTVDLAIPSLILSNVKLLVYGVEHQLQQYTVAGKDILDVDILKSADTQRKSSSAFEPPLQSSSTAPAQHEPSQPIVYPPQHHYQQSSNIASQMQPSQSTVMDMPASQQFQVVSPIHFSELVEPSIATKPQTYEEILKTLAPRQQQNANQQSNPTNKQNVSEFQSIGSSHWPSSPPRSNKVHGNNPTSKNSPQRRNNFDYGSSSPQRGRYRNKVQYHGGPDNSVTFDTNPQNISEDFDFAASLLQFDKSRIFAEMRHNDTVSPEARLVGHNLRSASNGCGGSESFLTKHQMSKHKSQPMMSFRDNVLDDNSTSDDEAGNNAEVEEFGIESDSAGPTSSKHSAQLSDVHSMMPNRSFRNSFDNGLVHSTNNIGNYQDNESNMKSGVGELRIDQFDSLPNQPSILRDGVTDLLDGKHCHFETKQGIYVPTVTPLEMLDIECITANEIGLSDEQMVENGGRSAAILAMQTLGESRIRLENHSNKPFIVVLVGNNKTGAYGLVAARHLVNHECRVLVCCTSNEAELIHLVALQKKIFFSTGGTLVKSARDLPNFQMEHVDIIIDAMLGSHQTLTELPTKKDRDAIVQMIEWANYSTNTPVQHSQGRATTTDSPTGRFQAPCILSIDMPSGISATTGCPTSLTYIQSFWTIAMGMAKTGHLRSHKYHGDLFLADIGIMPAVTQRISNLGGKIRLKMDIDDSGSNKYGVSKSRRAKAATRRYTPPFGDKYLVLLEHVSWTDVLSKNN